MDVTKLGMVIDDNAVCPNAHAPIDSTVIGMITEVNAVQLKNAPSAMDVI